MRGQECQQCIISGGEFLAIRMLHTHRKYLVGTVDTHRKHLVGTVDTHRKHLETIHRPTPLKG